MIVFPLSNSGQLGKGIARRSKAKTGRMRLELFPDGEFYLRYLDSMRGKEAILVQSMHPNPNDSLLELFWAARTAKDLGAKKVTGIIPYLAYTRQDTRFREGEALSNHIMAHLLNTCLDRIVTIDPHLHRARNLAELFHIERKKITANSDIARHIEKKFSAKDTVIIGPDIESSQWAARIAQKIGFESSIFLKKRHSPRKVDVNAVRKLDWKGKKAVIVDDIISSGHTMIEAIKVMRKSRAKEVHCICVHGIFAENAYSKMLKVGAKSIVSCNTVPHKSNRIDLAETVAKEGLT